MRPTLEAKVGIQLTCCRQTMLLAGNLACREAGAARTELGYECRRCFRRVMVVDEWSKAGNVFESDTVP